MKLNKGIRIALWSIPFLLFYAYIWHKGFEYPVVDDIMINQTILSHESMLLPYMGIGLSSILVAFQKIFQNYQQKTPRREFLLFIQISSDTDRTRRTSNNFHCLFNRICVQIWHFLFSNCLELIHSQMTNFCFVRFF